jgi:hypothetical protein
LFFKTNDLHFYWTKSFFVFLCTVLFFENEYKKATRFFKKLRFLKICPQFFCCFKKSSIHDNFLKQQKSRAKALFLFSKKKSFFQWENKKAKAFFMKKKAKAFFVVFVDQDFYNLDRQKLRLGELVSFKRRIKKALAFLIFPLGENCDFE